MNEISLYNEIMMPTRVTTTIEHTWFHVVMGRTWKIKWLGYDKLYVYAVSLNNTTWLGSVIIDGPDYEDAEQGGLSIMKSILDDSIIYHESDVNL